MHPNVGRDPATLEFQRRGISVVLEAMATYLLPLQTAYASYRKSEVAPFASTPLACTPLAHLACTAAAHLRLGGRVVPTYDSLHNGIKAQVPHGVSCKRVLDIMIELLLREQADPTDVNATEADLTFRLCRRLAAGTLTVEQAACLLSMGARPDLCNSLAALTQYEREEQCSGAAAFVLHSMQWSREAHALFPAQARMRARQVLQIGYLLGGSMQADAGRAFVDVWVEFVMPHAVQRSCPAEPVSRMGKRLIRFSYALPSEVMESGHRAPQCTWTAYGGQPSKGTRIVPLSDVLP